MSARWPVTVKNARMLTGPVAHHASGCFITDKNTKLTPLLLITEEPRPVHRAAAAARRFRTLLSTNGLANFHTEALVVVSVGSAFLHIAVYAILSWGITGQGPSSLTQTSLLHPSLAIVYGSTAVTIGTTVEVIVCALKTVFAFFVQVRSTWGRVNEVERCEG